MRNWLLSAVAALGIGLGATADQASAAPPPAKVRPAAMVCQRPVKHAQRYRAKKFVVKKGKGMKWRANYRHHRHAGFVSHHRRHNRR